MSKIVNSKLKFLRYEVNKIQFINNPDYEMRDVEIDLEFNSAIERSEDYIAQKVSIEVFPNALENGMPFQLQIDITGHFHLINESGEIDEKSIEINTLSILFPYVRSLITTITANANVPTLVLPLLNIIQTLEQNNEN
ncbi:protein-export chaperone SecB [Caryophanon latum]|uniref:Preprotein translocase subunit SecB n=1 Tax=Caryophanon latum TaxID=33977 RepID=A0A1C0YJH7_9BACL|nr:protein-export chaperone SecB [Caryophanon latum]OCS87303.1 hypothetical protein A6K76_02735 [Caryophanon latum]